MEILPIANQFSATEETTNLIKMPPITFLQSFTHGHNQQSADQKNSISFKPVESLSIDGRRWLWFIISFLSPVSTGFHIQWRRILVETSTVAPKLLRNGRQSQRHKMVVESVKWGKHNPPTNDPFAAHAAPPPPLIALKKGEMKRNNKTDNVTKKTLP